MTIDHDAIAALVEYASDLIDPLVTLAMDMERHAVEEWDESDFIIQVADTLRALISQNATYWERLEKAEAERDALRAALEEIADGLKGIARDIQIGPDDEGREIYEMVQAMQWDARQALKGQTQ